MMYKHADIRFKYINLNAINGKFHLAAKNDF